MNQLRSNVFIALQVGEDTRAVIEAIERDNANAVVNHYPGMVKIDAPGRLVVRRQTIEEISGTDFDLQSFQINLISLSGNLDETEDEIILEWKR